MIAPVPVESRIDRRKHRCGTSALFTLLTEAQRGQVAEWMERDEMNDAKISARILADFGHKISANTLRGFWNRHVVPRIKRESLARDLAPVVCELILQIRSNGTVNIKRRENS